MTTSEMLRLSWRSWLAWDWRTVGPGWLQWVWTGLFCAVVAVGFTLLSFIGSSSRPMWRTPGGWWGWYQMNLLISLLIGYTIHGLFTLTGRWLGEARIRGFSALQRTLYFGGLPLFGVALAWPIGMWLVAGIDLRDWADTRRLAINIGVVLLFCLLSFVFFESKARQITAEKQAVEAQLKLLQGQIEPHFLFNTLANVTALMEVDSARARTMLESFVDYLRASMAGLRSDRHTLGEELGLVDAYLRVVGLRMDDRLTVHIDVPDALRPLPLPALMLQPLVENAIRHGLEPKLEGGQIAVQARLQGASLVLTVEDTGLGQAVAQAQRTQGSGNALANIRQRLLQAFGSDASLVLEPVSPSGTRARLTLPAEC
jgi:signal transduction histidine kinase